MTRKSSVKMVQLLLVLCCATIVNFGGAAAQAPSRPAPTGTTPGQQAYQSPQAAFDTLVDAVRRVDTGQMQKLFGNNYREIVPVDPDDGDEARKKFLAACDKGRKINTEGDAKAILEVGDTGWRFPIPLVKRADGWRFDMAAGKEQMKHRQIGRNELAVIQVLLAIVDAQKDYFAANPMKTDPPQYARRLLSSPGKKDGLFWAQKQGDPESPLGELVAHAQAGGASQGYYGYNYRLLYAQGPNAPGGAYDYLVKDKMIGGYAIIAWPVRYGETGIKTFMVNHDGVVYEMDFGANTANAVAQIRSFDPDKSWEKSDTTP